MSRATKESFETEILKESFILIVDDNPVNLQVLGNILREQQYKTAVAKDGDTVLKFVKKRLPDLILLDIMMPKMDGFEVCRQLKCDETTREIPVIFISALTDTAEKLKGFHAGGVDYITKPFQKEEVLARVSAHLNLRRSHVQLQSLNQQLQEANASKDKFFSIIAHDLRSPFKTLLGFAQLLSNNFENYTPDKQKHLADRISDYAEQLHLLLENLLAWSRLQRGLMEHYPEEMSLYEIAEETIHLFQANAEQKQITLRNTIGEAITVYADSNMVTTIIRNLTSNALKFTDTGGAITLSAAPYENDVEITVSDTGVGMSAEDLSKLFRIDVNYNNVGTAGEKGTGLGLILCQELVEKNDGRIWAESEPGEGTLFKFTLPDKNNDERRK